MASPFYPCLDSQERLQAQPFRVRGSASAPIARELISLPERMPSFLSGGAVCIHGGGARVGNEYTDLRFTCLGSKCPERFHHYLTPRSHPTLRTPIKPTWTWTRSEEVPKSSRLPLAMS